MDNANQDNVHANDNEREGVYKPSTSSGAGVIFITIVVAGVLIGAAIFAALMVAKNAKAEEDKAARAATVVNATQDLENRILDKAIPADLQKVYWKGDSLRATFTLNEGRGACNVRVTSPTKKSPRYSTESWRADKQTIEEVKASMAKGGIGCITLGTITDIG